MCWPLREPARDGDLPDNDILEPCFHSTSGIYTHDARFPMFMYQPASRRSWRQQALRRRSRRLRDQRCPVFFAVQSAASGSTEYFHPGRSHGLDRSTLGRNLRVLEGEGLVALNEGEDMRNRIVRLTEAGAERLAAALPAWEAAQQRLIDRLGAEKRETLLKLLDELA